MNIVFVGGFSYPGGMAGTKRVQLTIDGLRQHKDVTTRVVVLRQPTSDNTPAGVHEGVPYETLMPDVLGLKAGVLSPLLWKKTVSSIRRCWKPDCRNILYHYGPPCFDSAVPLRRMRRFGWKVVWDFVEDDDLGGDISRSLYHRLKNHFRRCVTSRISTFADGIVVISTHLERKFKKLTGGAVPIHLHPISVSMARFPAPSDRGHHAPSLFYGGSYGVKDGVEDLLAAFDRLAAEYPNLRLVMSGRGTDERMRLIQQRIQASPARSRIDYRGYLDEDAYYQTLNAVSIPCMTRIDSPYAHAGFPFKLGEFLATGKPVVATKASDVGSLLADRRHAALVESGSVDGIVGAVRYLLDDPERAKEIGREGRKLAEERFDFRRQATPLYTFLRSLDDGHSTRFRNAGNGTRSRKTCR